MLSLAPSNAHVTGAQSSHKAMGSVFPTFLFNKYSQLFVHLQERDRRPPPFPTPCVYLLPRNSGSWPADSIFSPALTALSAEPASSKIETSTVSITMSLGFSLKDFLAITNLISNISSFTQERRRFLFRLSRARSRTGPSATRLDRYRASHQSTIGATKY